MKGKTDTGILCGVLAGMSFGLIPLFSIPVISVGMGDASILLYRFMFGSVAMLAVLPKARSLAP